jgi:aminoglycoside phosphotransferase (APT) family kinase protein
MASESDDLGQLLSNELGTPITGLTRLSGGASRETWRFAADERQLVVQLQRAGDIRDMMVEAAVVVAAGAAGVPVPAMVASGRREDGGAFMIVQAIEGETIARKIQRDEEFRAARDNFAARCGAALARIHSIDPGSIEGLDDPDQIEQYTAVLHELGEPHPAFELTRNWLLEHRPAEARRCLVHGDFRLGNLIVGAAGLGAIIDWELAHVGDPMEDLGWLCVKAWRFGGPNPVGGIGTRSELFAAYEAAGGGAVDPAAVRWWEVLGTWKWGIMCVLQANAHRSGAVRSHELAAIGRRVCENEFDLLDPNGLDLFGLSGVGLNVVDVPVRSSPAVEGGPHDVPTSAELIEAVREWLERDVISSTEGRLRFHSRVAVNVLSMVEREMALGGAQATAHSERLIALGVDSENALADLIRSGDAADREAEIVAALFDGVVDKLRVANPKSLHSKHPYFVRVHRWRTLCATSTCLRWNEGAVQRLRVSVTGWPAASWPQAASMSVPRFWRTVALAPKPSSASRNAYTFFNGVPIVGYPGVGLSGIRFT